MAKEEKKEEKKPDEKKPVLLVTTMQPGFRRAGRQWHGATTVYEEELSKEQIDQLKAEPKLVVQEL